MSSNQRKEQLKNFLTRFDSSPIVLSDSHHPIGPMEEFVLTFFGKCFMQGYRILQKIEDNFFVLSLQEFQHGGNPAYKQATEKKHSLLKIIIVQFKQVVNQDREYRASKFQEIRLIIQFFCGQTSNCSGVQVYFLFAHNFLYSKTTFETLQKCSTLTLEKFYNRDYGMNKKQFHEGLKILDEKIQGVRLHELVELLLKGGGIIWNQKHLSKNVLHQAKFAYKLDKIINTICFIIGKQMIEGDFLTISSEKWMRKFSQKKFKKFDLLMRNRKKVCIIDWKFSKVNADEKISTELFAKKNLEYFQLARKQYNSEVELKFYCFHQTKSQSHHKFTCATYKYSIEEIEIKDFYSINDNNEIQIDSDSSLQIERYQKISHRRKQQKQNIFQRLDSDSDVEVGVEIVENVNNLLREQIREDQLKFSAQVGQDIIQIRQQQQREKSVDKNFQRMLEEQSKNGKQPFGLQENSSGNSNSRQENKLFKSTQGKGERKYISLASEDQSQMIEYIQVEVGQLPKTHRQTEKRYQENLPIGTNFEMILDSISQNQTLNKDNGEIKEEKGKNNSKKERRNEKNLQKNVSSKQKVPKMAIKQRKLAAKKDFIEID